MSIHINGNFVPHFFRKAKYPTSAYTRFSIIKYILKKYIDNALEQTEHKKVKDHLFYCWIPSIEGIAAYGTSKEDCKSNMFSIFGDLIVSRLEKGLDLPVINKIDLKDVI